MASRTSSLIWRPSYCRTLLLCLIVSKTSFSIIHYSFFRNPTQHIFSIRWHGTGSKSEPEHDISHSNKIKICANLFLQRKALLNTCFVKKYFYRGVKRILKQAPGRAAILRGSHDMTRRIHLSSTGDPNSHDQYMKSLIPFSESLRKN